MKAELLVRRRVNLSDGSFAEIVIWKVPGTVRGSRHQFKYRLAYVIAGECVLRYDNEAGKGDHVHRSDGEVPYLFTSLDRLLSDFMDEVSALEDKR